jgi:predicted ABC-type exoprotein transport system permease subunit
MKIIMTNIKPLLAIFILLLGFAYYFINLFNHTKPNDQILIAIVSLTSQVTAYYFGASTGNTKKDETIQRLSER